jgi:DNA-binding MarR family transcriptional regulator
MNIRQAPDQGKSSKSSRARRRLAGAESQEPRKLLASTGFLLARLGMESRRRFARMMAGHGLSTHHFGLLVALGEHDLVAQQELGRVMGVDPRNAVPLIDELEKGKLIERRPDPHDRRRYNVTLTQTGRRMMLLLRRDGAELEEEMLKGLDAEERASLHGLLMKLFEAMGEEM